MPPSISSTSGAWNHGNSVTISGSGFGTKSPATPHWWDDFESGILGSNIEGRTPLYGPANWDAGSIGGTNHEPTITDTQQRHSLSTRCAVCDDDPAEGNWNIRIRAPITALGDGAKFYYFFRHRLSKNGVFSDNFKPADHYNSAFSADLYIGMGHPDTDPVLRTDNVMSDAPGALFNGSSQSAVLDTWVAYEEEIGLALSGGTRRGWLHTPGAISQVWDDQAMNRTLTAGNTIVNCTFGEYHNTGYNYIYHIDEVYIDNTFARVMVGDAATFTACAVREIQIPTAWSSNSITVIVKRNTFGLSATAYLYVIDSNGSPNSSGVPITFGGTGGDLITGLRGIGSIAGIPSTMDLGIRPLTP